MPWARFGDNAATYPKLMMVRGFPGADSRAVNEVRGWLWGCATQSAAHVTDYVIDYGTAEMFGGARTRKLINWCVKAGLLTPIEIDGVTHWALINDPAFIHIRTKDELEWDRRRREDSRNKDLIVPVRLRDGDNCRYCGVQVHWTGVKSNRSGEYDHRDPGVPAESPDDLVVACRSCNGSRKENPAWNKHPLRPPPSTPLYGAYSATFLTNNGYPTQPNLEPDATTTRSSADTAGPRPRPAAARGTARKATEPGPGSAAEPSANSTSNRVSDSDRTSCVGSGRVGSDPGPDPDQAEPGHGPPGGRSRRRRSRGRRGGGTRPDQHDQPHQPPDDSTPDPTGDPDA